MRPSVSSGFTIRRARPADHARCAELYLKVRRSAFHWQNSNIFLLDDYQQSVQDEEVWVAELNGEIVAFASIYRPENFVHNLFVDTRYQHRGIGSKLLNAILATMDGAAHLKCLAANTAARIFYERQGWVEETRGEHAFERYILYCKLVGDRITRPGMRR